MEESPLSPPDHALGDIPNATLGAYLPPIPPLQMPHTSSQPVRDSVAKSLNIDASSTAENKVADIDSVDEPKEKDDDEPANKKQKKTTSMVWTHFTKVTQKVEVDGKTSDILWAQCNKCKYKTRGESKNGTKVLWNHLKGKHNIQGGQQELKVENTTSGGVCVEPFRYDQDASLKKFYLAIIMHEYPFNIVEHEYFIDWVKSMRPSFPMKSRITVRNELMGIFKHEKNKLYEYFKTVKSRFSTTMDMWTSNQNKGYMCITVHWIDADWHIQKRIIKFMHVGGRHTGAKLSDAFTSSIVRWFIEKKMFSLTLDNASANDICVKDVVAELGKICPLVSGGMFFHVRCANHILNLVARDGLAAISGTVKNIRAFVVAIKSSPLQLEEFMKCAAELGLDTKKGVSLDVATRWNSTYLMLKNALYYKNAFNRLHILERQRYENISPSDEEWAKASTLCRCLKKFNDITELLSGTQYPTANLFYRNFCEIKVLLAEWSGSPDTTIQTMALSMSAKFEKYWKKSNVALAVASLLDPRFKKGIIEFYMRKFCGEFFYRDEMDRLMKIVKDLYQEYASDTAAHIMSKDSPVAVCHGGASNENDSFTEEETNELESFLYYGDNRDVVTTDLDKYLAEPLLHLPKSDTFDVLSWWKAHQEVFPILSRLARDVLAMQVSTVASESAFSAGGRVIDPFRSRLDPDMVEALVCTKDWIAASRKDSQKNIASIVDDLVHLEVLETIHENRVVQGEEEKEMSSDED